MNIRIAQYGLIAGAVVILVLIGALVLKIQDNKDHKDDATTTRDDEIHYHAGFIVYEDDVPVDFAALKYMQLSPCEDPDGSDHAHGDTPESTEQLEKAHLHDLVGDVVHVHRDHALWKDLFLNIGYELQEPVTAYRDGIIVEDILEQPIIENESVLFITGLSSLDPSSIPSVTLNHIVEIGQRSENCGTSTGEK